MIKAIQFTIIILSVAIVSFAVGYFILPLSLPPSKLVNHLLSATTFENIVGFCTAVGSLATFGTLVYLILQNKEHKAHEAQQIKMWNEQNEMLCFQKYQTHRDEFFNLIDSIEARYEGIFVIQHKNRLYRRLFPRNSFVGTLYDYENETLCTDNPFFAFESVVDEYKKETSVLKLKEKELRASEIADEAIRNAVYKLDLCTCKLLNLFELECVLSPTLGFVHDGDFVVMDGLSPFMQIGRLVDIINEFRQFANMPPYYGKGGGFHQPIAVAKNVIPYYINKNEHSSRTIFGENLVVALLELQEIIESLDGRELEDMVISYIKPLDFFVHKSLLNNFDYNIETIANELCSRVEKLRVSCKDEIDNHTEINSKLIKLASDLKIISSKG